MAAVCFGGCLEPAGLARGAGAEGTLATVLFFLPHPVTRKIQAAIKSAKGTFVPRNKVRNSRGLDAPVLREFFKGGPQTARRAGLTSSILYHSIEGAQLRS